MSFSFAIRLTFDRYDIIRAIGFKARVIAITIGISQVKNLDSIARIEIVHAAIVSVA